MRLATGTCAASDGFAVNISSVSSATTSLLRLCRAISRVLTPSVSKLAAGFGAAPPNAPRKTSIDSRLGERCAIALASAIGMKTGGPCPARDTAATASLRLVEPGVPIASTASISPRSIASPTSASVSGARTDRAKGNVALRERGVEQRLTSIGLSRLFHLHNADPVALQVADLAQSRAARREQHRGVAAHDEHGLAFDRDRDVAAHDGEIDALIVEGLRAFGERIDRQKLKPELFVRLRELSGRGAEHGLIVRASRHRDAQYCRAFVIDRAPKAPAPIAATAPTISEESESLHRFSRSPETIWRT